MKSETLSEAADALRRAEGPTRAEWIGCWSTGGTSGHPHAELIGEWAARKRLAGVVWAALPPKWNDIDGNSPSKEDVLTFLEGLKPDRIAAAKQYILCAPRQIATPWRPELEAALL
jgi:hypothetical protein